MSHTAATYDPNDRNPYRSPLASSKPDALDSTGAAAVRHPFRWRLIPVTMLHLYGGSLIFVAMLSTIHMIVWSLVFIHRGWGVKFSWVSGVMRGAVVGAVLGLLIIYAARDFWRFRWQRGTIELASAILLYAVFASLGGRLIGI